jgi:hypothetical protein
MARTNLSSLSLSEARRKAVPLVISFAVFVLAYSLLQDDLKRVALFGALVLVFTIFKFDSRIPILYAILLLLVTAVLTSLKADSAKQMAILSYWFLVGGTISILIDAYRKPQVVH